MYKRILINRYVVALLFFVISAVVIIVTTINRSRSKHPDKFGIGRAAKPEEIAALDIDVRPDGKGLPAGTGRSAAGKLIYEAKCIACHGNGEKTETPLLGEALFLNEVPGAEGASNGVVASSEKAAFAKASSEVKASGNAKASSKGKASAKKSSGEKGDRSSKTIGTYWPYATTIFDYVRRAMPYNAPGSLSNQEVYDLTAYLLYRNHIISENTIVTEQSLPQIVMPSKKKFVEDDRKGGAELR
ncbi:cytochrome c [Pedobacter sp. MC2016-15]|uniref:c-type cytochrome n=1 Tax=Pedobacter sp. MC2016-15 TaxID=2994473 RepID=UPI0022457652|nr:cytochrome c [Pedobacter sp. MC2016-15]MCX2477814.1 cytochrome c [Pedobacter sp. MC2016-15]